MVSRKFVKGESVYDFAADLRTYVAIRLPDSSEGGKPREGFQPRHTIVKPEGNRKCYACGGYGHEAKACATKKSVCGNLLISMFDGKYCLLDTGVSAHNAHNEVVNNKYQEKPTNIRCSVTS